MFRFLFAIEILARLRGVCQTTGWNSDIDAMLKRLIRDFQKTSARKCIAKLRGGFGVIFGVPVAGAEHALAFGQQCFCFALTLCLRNVQISATIARSCRMRSVAATCGSA